MLKGAQLGGGHTGFRKAGLPGASYHALNHYAPPPPHPCPVATANVPRPVYPVTKSCASGKPVQSRELCAHHLPVHGAGRTPSLTLHSGSLSSLVPSLRTHTQGRYWGLGGWRWGQGCGPRRRQSPSNSFSPPIHSFPATSGLCPLSCSPSLLTTGGDMLIRRAEGHW